MTGQTVHRIVEQHAAFRGTDIALSDGERTMTYRDLNVSANMVARRLQAQGFRRGGHALVTMAPGIDLAVTLLAILKMGGAYTWREPSPFVDEPGGASFAVPPQAEGREVRYLHLDLAPAFADTMTCCPNLPIVTRPTDTACVMPNADGTPAVLVPHATIVGLRERPMPRPAAWGSDPNAFDLWMALMAGTTAAVDSRAAAVAA